MLRGKSLLERNTETGMNVELAREVHLLLP